MWRYEIMKITHLQSSTQLIEMGNIKILTDPWLTDGEYYGSWYHYPPFGDENIATLQYDYIYVSHIHPDHLSEKTLKKLPLKKPIIIHKYEAKFLKRKIESLGFEVIECDNAAPLVFENGGAITIYAADNCNPALCGKFFGCGSLESRFGSTQIDTLALFEYDDKLILNTNDCPVELASHTIRAHGLQTRPIDLLLVGYTGAGPYPQCFEFESQGDLLQAAREKEHLFLQNALKFIELVQPKAFAPFAGTYILGSNLSHLNDIRGVPNVADASKYLNRMTSTETHGLCLSKFSKYDLLTQQLSNDQSTYHVGYEDYVKMISAKKLDYDDDSWDDAELLHFAHSAYKRFKEKAEEIRFQSKTKIVVKTKKIAFSFSSSSGIDVIDQSENLPEPYVEVELSHNLLHRLLRGPRFAHWNNAEIGSHLRYSRRPDIFERGLYHCMCFFHE